MGTYGSEAGEGNSISKVERKKDGKIGILEKRSYEEKEEEEFVV